LNETDVMIAQSFTRMEAKLDCVTKTVVAHLDSGFAEIANRMDVLLEDIRADRLEREQEWAARGLDSSAPPQA
jgi:hypothetical protein